MLFPFSDIFRLINNVCEAVNLFFIIFYTYVGKVKLLYMAKAFNSFPYHRVLARALPCLAIGVISITSCKVQMIYASS
jgi:hypothetical protein